MAEIERLISDLGHPGVPLEIAALIGCVVSAYGISWLIGHRHSGNSVWFGRGIIDGLLFPLLALLLTYSAGIALNFTDHKVVLLRIAMPVLISLAGIRLLARVFTVAFPHSHMARLIERLFSWLAWLCTALWIVGLLQPLLEEMDTMHVVVGKSRISLLGLSEVVLALSVMLVVVLWISAVLERHVLSDAVNDPSLRKVATSLLRTVLVVAGVLLALSIVGVDLTTLSVLGGAIGVGLGFGLQKIAANYISGFVILTERSVRIGDTVRVDNIEGVVADIKTRYTLIRSLTGRESIVPNEKMINERIENLSLADPFVMLSVDVTVAYNSDVEQVERILMDAVRETPRVLADPEPAARLAKLSADGLQYTVLFWIKDPQQGQLNVKSDVNLRILKGLREADIEIPLVQRVVQVTGSVPLTR
jgi:small-conductance mechanosensitive channel